MEKAEIEAELILQALSVALSELSKKTVFRGHLKVALLAKRKELAERHVPEDQLHIAPPGQAMQTKRPAIKLFDHLSSAPVALPALPNR